ncbi:MAG: presenilin family intramembrane aspartyl protease [Candidatus Diapherotrites archaeon]|nr:presenilin family intramembrane aspartyl protease [Candidatus Diapherotrites archaeon]
MQKTLLIQLITIFLITQILGIFVSLNLIQTELKVELVNENANDVSNSLFLFAQILIMTGVMLLGIKLFKKGFFLRILEGLAILFSSYLVFWTIIPDLAFMFSVLLLGLKNFMQDNFFVKNIVSILAVTGVGSLLGVSLGIIPVIVFLVLLAVYDLIAVFVTKHMLVLAKPVIEKNLAFTVTMPTKEHAYQLGTGDLVIPLVFASSLLNEGKSAGLLFPNFLIFPVIILLASLIGLIVTLEIAEKYQKPLPALPLQVVLMIVVWFSYKILVPI